MVDALQQTVNRAGCTISYAYQHRAAVRMVNP